MNTSATENTAQPWTTVPGYLKGPKYDHILIFGVLMLALCSGLVVWLRPELFLTVFLLDIWLLGYHHVIATFTKLAGTPQDRAQNSFLIYQLPLLVLAGVVGLYLWAGIWLIITIYFFWQWFHYTRQSYGISVFYRKKSGIQHSATPVRLDYAAIWAIPVWGLIHRCAQDWDKFLFLPVWMPDLPMELSYLAGAAALSIVSVWLVTKAIDWHRGNLSYCAFFFMLSHQIIFFAGYVFIPDINIGWLVANVWHNAQYILFVWLFNNNRFRPRTDQSADINNRAQTQKTNIDKDEGKIMAWLSQPKPYRIMFYFGFCLLATTLFYGSVQAGLKFALNGNEVLLIVGTVVIFQAVNFHHYIVDSLIWKARKKSNQKIMKV
ncbi:MAG: hypothetical protein ACQEQL_09110 [Pseudomonadota bacterium]